MDPFILLEEVVHFSLEFCIIGEKEYSLEKLLNGISKNNLHGEFDTGAPVGKEIWLWRAISFHVEVMWFG